MENEKHKTDWGAVWITIALLAIAVYFISNRYYIVQSSGINFIGVYDKWKHTYRAYEVEWPDD